MIGGKITIPNGRYPIMTGDQVMWYFEEEGMAKMFDTDGMRTKRTPISVQNKKKKLDYNDDVSKRQQLVRDIVFAERAGMMPSARIKPCILGIDRRGATYADTTRIIGIACSNAGAYERVDIKLSRMSH
jgi:hypothetical protein